MQGIKKRAKQLKSNDDENKPDEKVDNTLRDTALGAGALGLGASQLPQGYRQSAGIKRLYHGVHDDDAKQSILDEGLDPSKGGQNYEDMLQQMGRGGETRGQTYATPSYLTGLHYAFKDPDEIDNFSNQSQFDALQASPSKASNVLSINETYENFQDDYEVDPDFAQGIDRDDAKKHIKHHISSRTDQKVSPDKIMQSDAYSKVDELKDRAQNLPDYIKDHPKRFSKGLATTAIGAGLAGYGGKKLYDTHIKDEKTLQDDAGQEQSDNESMM